MTWGKSARDLCTWTALLLFLSLRLKVQLQHLRVMSFQVSFSTGIFICREATTVLVKLLLMRISDFFDYMNSPHVPYPKAVIKPTSWLERSHKSPQRQMWLHPWVWADLGCQSWFILCQYLRNIVTCVYIYAGMWSFRKSGWDMKKRQEKELLKIQCNFRNLSLQIDL